MHIRHYAHTDIGQTRAHNEDAHLADPDLRLFVVADGVGGRAKGEVASAQAVELVWEWIKRHEHEIARYTEQGPAQNAGELCRIVRGAIQNATYLVHTMGLVDPDQKGMSTTVSALLLCNNVGIVGQVGDSRVYLVRGEHVSQLTEDHTLINFQLKHGLITPAQAAASNSKNIITRAVGHKDYVEVDTLPIELQAGDRIVLCSDGFHGYVDDPNDLRYFTDQGVEEAVIAGIHYANEHGGSDNITVMVIELGDEADERAHGT